MSDQHLRAPRVNRCPRLVLAAALTAGVFSSGCARTLTLTQTEYINTGQHIEEGRDQKDQTGVPLELDIVCVYPRDLKNEANDRLKPGSGLTAKEWYERRPLPSDRVDMEESHNRFRLPKSQIYLMTNDPQFYGSRIGACLRGAKLDGDKPIFKSGIEFAWTVLHDENSVLYVFPKFTRKGGEVLPVAPVIFHPPGAYEKDLYIRIGVDGSRGNFGQYAEIDSAKGNSKKPGSGSR